MNTSNEQHSKNYNGVYKVIVIGTSNTGKTSFVRRWTKNTFDPLYHATIGADQEFRIVEKGDSLFQIAIWDLPGMDYNPYLSKIFSKDAYGCVIMADATNKKTLDDALKWKMELDKEVCFPDMGALPCVLVENKIDLLNDIERRDMQGLVRFAKNNHFDAAFRVSVKEGINVEQAMEALIDIIFERLEKVEQKENSIVRIQQEKVINVRKNAKYFRSNNYNKCC